MTGSPRRAGIIGTVVAHSLLVIGTLVGLSRVAGPTPMVYAVDLLAAPLPTEAPRRAATEATPTKEAEVAPPVKPPTKQPKPEPEKPKPSAAAQRDEKQLQVRSTNTPAPGETPSTGRDQVTVKQEGFQSQFPGYVNNIVEQVRVRWPQPTSARSLKTEVSFTILRDGSIAGLEIVLRSGSYAFDLAAMAAVEAAGNARAFGALPTNFPGDALPVTFFFTPKGVQ